jgi:hypothetical protein
MKNIDALRKAQEIIQVNLKAVQTPARADVGQLIEGYPLIHAIEILDNLIKSFAFEENDDGK